MTRVALDSNILVCLAGVRRTAADEVKIAAIRAMLARLAPTASPVEPAHAKLTALLSEPG